MEVDEAYFGGRKKGTRGRGAKAKVAVFGMKVRNGQLRMEVIDDVGSETLNSMVSKNVAKGSTVYSDMFRGYNGLKGIGFDYKKIDHSKYFANGPIHSNGIVGAWSYAKERMAKFHGVSPHKFPLYLTKMEERFNHREEDFFGVLVERSCKFIPSFL